MTCRAAPTTSGPMPSPGRSNISNESRKLPPRTPALTPATRARQDLERPPATPRPAPRRRRRFFPKRAREAAQKSSPNSSTAATPSASSRFWNAICASASARPRKLRAVKPGVRSIFTDASRAADRAFGRPPRRRLAARAPGARPGCGGPPARAERRAPARARAPAARSGGPWPEDGRQLSGSTRAGGPAERVKYGRPGG